MEKLMSTHLSTTVLSKLLDSLRLKVFAKDTRMSGPFDLGLVQ
jgi:hypothetical protein